MSEPYVRAFIPTCEGYGWTGAPGFSTRIVTRLNGRERRNADWSQPQYSFSLPFVGLTQDRYAPIAQMFLNRMGAWGVFLYRNPLDYSALNEPFGVGDGTTTEFQLSKQSVIDGVVFTRYVRALYVPGNDGDGMTSTITVTVNGSPTAVTVDYDRGIVTFGAPPANLAALRWSGQFAHWVRFVSDKLPATIVSQNANSYIAETSVDLLEMPPPDERSS
jgi:uncharacterized protein (TIGR02217 family)